MKNKKNIKKAFTLAEVMIVLTVIGILTAVMLSAAFRSSPDEKIMKFKKAHASLYSGIRNLINSNKYYKDGDLGTRGDLGGNVETASRYKKISGETTCGGDSHVCGLGTKDYMYFCYTFAEVLTFKNKACSSSYEMGDGEKFVTYDPATLSGTGSLAALKTNVDSQCKAAQSHFTNGYEILGTDGVHWFQTSPMTPFGKMVNTTSEERIFPDPATTTLDSEENRRFKVMCFDVDGPKQNESDDNEDPFGYAIRVDGLIIPGARADLWLEKSLNKKDE